MIEIISLTPIEFKAEEKDLVPGTKICEGRFISRCSDLSKNLLLIVTNNRADKWNPLYVSRYTFLGVKDGKLHFIAGGACALRSEPATDLDFSSNYPEWLNGENFLSFNEELESYLRGGSN